MEIVANDFYRGRGVSASKEMARAIGAWVKNAGFRGVFPWAANYDSFRDNNSLVTWVNEGLGDLPHIIL